MYWTVWLLAVIQRTVKNAKLSILYNTNIRKKGMSWEIRFFKVYVMWNKCLPASVKVIVTMCIINI